MKFGEFFKNVLTYSASAENWVHNYFKSVGFKPEYTFVRDFATADWFGKDHVLETYHRIKTEWLSDYKTFTEVVMAVNMLAWFNDQLDQQEIEREGNWAGFYSDLYLNARCDFYKKWEGNEEACDYFFNTTD